MDIKEHTDYWIKSAENDLDVARSLYKSRKYDWCLFVGHIVLEKMLKALYVKNNDNKIPLKTHNLVKLSELSLINITNKQKLFLDEVNDFNIEIRYPDYKFEFHKHCDDKFSKKYLEKIEEYYKWLKSLTE